MIYLQKYSANGLGREEKAILQHLILNRIDYRFIREDELNCDLKKKIANCELFVGSVEGVNKALEALDCATPKPNYYPLSLRSFLKRKVWQGRVSDLNNTIEKRTIFIKPFDNWKSFNGVIVSSKNKQQYIEKYPADMKLWFSEVVRYTAEFRVYVINGKCTAICQYAGDEDIAIDDKEIQEAISILNLQDDQQKTYSFDWGITDDGEVSLVELNGCFAIGKYHGITDSQYFSFLMSGWLQLVK